MDDAPDTQYRTQIDQGTVSIEGSQGRLEVGPVDRIVEEVGSETYTIRYDARSSSVYDWLDDESQTLEIEVREALSSYPIPVSVVRALGEIPIDTNSPPTRPAYFSDLVTSIWDAKGDMDAIEELTGGHVGPE